METETTPDTPLPSRGDSDRIQRDLDAVQAVLDGLDRIAPTTSAGDDPAGAILALVATGFDPDPSFQAGSDLVGDGHVVAVEQVEPVSESESGAVAVAVDPPASEVRDAVPAGAEELLDRHDHPTVGDHHHL